MSRSRRINSNVTSKIDTGFGTNSSDYGGRFLNKDGKANLEKQGVGFFEKISWYHTMLSIPRWKFISLIFLFFIVINLFFAVIYLFIGVNHLNGMEATTGIGKFAEAFFFSCQTFTTVGYGRINPEGFGASSVASFEALIGLLNFALITGLLYGRFSRPTAYLRFSENAILAPYKEGTAIMLRVAPFKNTTLVEAEANITLGMAVEENGKMVNKFFQLPLEFSSVNTLTLSWTIVHPIIETSPLYQYTEADFASSRVEILVFVKAFDDLFSNIVISRTSYTFNEITFGAKFNPMYTRSTNGSKTILYLDKLNSFSKADVSHAFIEKENEKILDEK